MASWVLSGPSLLPHQSNRAATLMTDASFQAKVIESAQYFVERKCCDLTLF